MSYAKFTNYLRTAEENGLHITGFIVFSPASFEQEYSPESRTYEVSSNNKAFQPGMGGYSIYASSVDGSDMNVRIERYMAAERGGRYGWQIERCYISQSELDKVKPFMDKDREAR